MAHPLFAFVQNISARPLVEQQEIKEAPQDFFYDDMTKDKIEETIKYGELFMENTKDIRTVIKYALKDEILSTNPTSIFFGFDPRSLDIMLEKIFDLDEQIIEAVKTRQVKK